MYMHNRFLFFDSVTVASVTLYVMQAEFITIALLRRRGGYTVLALSVRASVHLPVGP